MDYYASWPVWKMPKWLGAALGGIFTVIIIGCAWLIVDLTRPPVRRVAAAPLAPATSATKAVASAPTASPVVPPTASPVVAPTPSPVVAPTAAADALAAAKPATPPKTASAKTHSPSPLHKRAILAKHDAKSTRPKKDELDRLLGL